MPDVQPLAGDSRLLRCRRYVGARSHSNDGTCGLTAKVVINGDPLCYVHTPVAYRRRIAGHGAERVPGIGRETPASG